MIDAFRCPFSGNHDVLETLQHVGGHEAQLRGNPTHFPFTVNH